MFSRHIETGEALADQQLQTRYYKTTKDKLFSHILDDIAKDTKMTLIGESKDRGEISIQYNSVRKSFLVLTIISVRPYHTAVDISMSIERGLNFGYIHRYIQSFYERLNQTFPSANQSQA
ncbi:cytosolic protein [Tuberibacillus sp. Marseille-P3662]|uniref:cytosolic protein n=1 Tax=Tuberibacillus sp. Marseille-P3662 TaxID=1965358 RepID=UPI00111BDE63|nr:cytosolic protein [Tuberibacillus sp. Marseille-P3662]